MSKAEPLLYCLQEGLEGPIKIGVSCNPELRMEGFQTGNSSELRLLLVMEGGYELETDLHMRFSGWRLQGEWFEPAEELLSWIDAQEDCEGGRSGLRLACSRIEQADYDLASSIATQRSWTLSQVFREAIHLGLAQLAQPSLNNAEALVAHVLGEAEE